MMSRAGQTAFNEELEALINRYRLGEWYLSYGEIIGGLALWQHLLASEALDSEDDDALSPKDGEG